MPESMLVQSKQIRYLTFAGITTNKLKTHASARFEANVGLILDSLRL